MEPSTTSTNGSSLPSSAWYQYFRKSSPTSYASTGLCRCTRGSPGIAPNKTSSMLGWVAAVTETESPSQPRPAVIHRMCTSETGEGFCVTRPYGTVSAAITAFSFPTQLLKNGGRIPGKRESQNESNPLKQFSPRDPGSRFGPVCGLEST